MSITTASIIFEAVAVTATTGTSYKTTISGDFDTTKAHHYVGVFNGATSTIKVYVDGIDATKTTVTSSTGMSRLFLVTAQTGIYQEIATFNYALTQAQALLQYQYGVLQAKESSSTRATRILTNSSFPVALRNFTTSPIAQVNDLTVNSTILNELQIVNSSEGGELYIDRLGVLTLTNREYFGATRSAVSQASFVDTGTGVYYDHASIRFQYDADQLRNTIEIQFSNGGSTINSDATSIAANGEAGDSRSTIIADLDTSVALAARLVTIYKNPKLRIEPFMVKGQRNPSYDWPRLLALELLDRFTFIRTPSTGSAVTQDMLLQSIEHRITPGTWETVVNGSARFTGWFIIGTSLLGGTDVLL
jgi:hypothetical protein